MLYAEDAAQAEANAAAAFARLDELEQVMSDYRPGSELMQLRDAVGTGPVPASPALFEILDRTLSVSAATGGAFDPTLGPLTQLWREARRTGRPPDRALLEDARSRTGWERITLDREARTVLLPAGTRLDLGGIGKGYAAHETVKLLRTRGIPRCLVALAGDIALGDPPPPPRPESPVLGYGDRRDDLGPRPSPGWRIAIGGTSESVLLSNSCISTSGDTEQFVEIDGVRYSHILDPRTGLGLTRRVQATVIHSDGATADALATALCVAGVDGAPAVLDRFPEALALVLEPSETGTREHRSARFSTFTPR